MNAKHRAVMKQAVDALQFARNQIVHLADVANRRPLVREIGDSIESLRAALDEPVQEPVAPARRPLTPAQEAAPELLEALRQMVEMFKGVPTLEQNSFDEPPEPRTQWDYEAYLMLGAARAAIAKVEGSHE